MPSQYVFLLSVWGLLFKMFFPLSRPPKKIISIVLFWRKCKYFDVFSEHRFILCRCRELRWKFISEVLNAPDEVQKICQKLIWRNTKITHSKGVHHLLFSFRCFKMEMFVFAFFYIKFCCRVLFIPLNLVWAWGVARYNWSYTSGASSRRKRRCASFY